MDDRKVTYQKKIPIVVKHGHTWIDIAAMLTNCNVWIRWFKNTYRVIKGVVDNINDVLDIFNAHIRTQQGRLPQKIY